MARRPRAICPHCDTSLMVRGDGKFRDHEHGGQPCPGSLQTAPEQPGMAADEYIAVCRADYTNTSRQVRPITKYGEARLLHDIDAGRVWTDGKGRVWHTDLTSNAGGKKPAGRPVESVEANGWATRGGDGVEVLTGDGKTALAAWDATHNPAVGAVTVR